MVSSDDDLDDVRKSCVLVHRMFGTNVGCDVKIYLAKSKVGKSSIPHRFKCVMVLYSYRTTLFYHPCSYPRYSSNGAMCRGHSEERTTGLSMGFPFHPFIDSWSEIALDGVSRWKHGAIRFVLIEPSLCHQFIFATVTDVEENIIGQKILTRSLNNEFEAEDITDHYKASDRSSKHQEQLADRLKNDVDVQLKVPESIRVSLDNLLSFVRFPRSSLARRFYSN